MNKSVFLNLDFMPPVTEQLLLLPQYAGISGIKSLYIKLIDNFPWEFDCRMKSDSSYPENVVEYFIRACSNQGIGVEYFFPDIHSFSRILRLIGYSRMGIDLDGFRVINPEAVGFKSLMESVVDDVVSLIPDIGRFLLKKTSFDKPDGRRIAELYNRIVSESIIEAGYEVEFIDHDTVFIYADKIIRVQDESGLTELYTDLKQELEYYHRAFFSLKEFCVMNTLSSNSPTSAETNLYLLFNDFSSYQSRVEKQIDSFAVEAAKLIEPAWLELYLKAIKLTIAGDASDISNRLRQQGFLN